MSVPSKVVGAGNASSAQNVFKVTFSQALASVPTLEAWDDATFATVAKEMFAGTAVNGNIPFLSAVATSNGAPASNWKPASPGAGGATANRLKGTTNYVNLAAAAPGAGGYVRFNLCWEIPSDASVPSTNTMNGVLAIRFAYSGATPSLTWQFNDSGAGGTEGAPSWTTITPGAAGHVIRPADASATSANLVLTKPTSSTLDAATVWVAAS